MITVIPVRDGSFNVIGTDPDVDGFIVTGNLTKAQLQELIREAEKAIGLPSLPRCTT